LFLLNGAAWVVPISLLVAYKGWSNSPQFAVVMTFLMDVLLLATTLVYVAPGQRGPMPEADRLRILVLTQAALVGLTAALIGMGLPFTARLKPIFSAGLDEWRKHPGALLLCGTLLFGGLGLMFVGLQLARQYERTRSEMRRLLYGYNAFLAVLFLFAILALVNLLAYAHMKPFTWFGKARDWTSSRIYSLTPESEDFLSKLKEPVQVYIMVPGGEMREEITTLLDNCRSVTDKITWTFVSRDRDDQALRDLQRKFVFKEAEGMLVVVGTGAEAMSDFIKPQDLYDDRSMMMEESTRENFKGEPALMKSIDYLTSGKAKGKVYFTQGHGELDVHARGGGRGEDGVGVLWERLGQGNYEFHDVDLSREDKIPADADVVVVAQPRRQLSPKAVTALEDYAEKKNGKLIIMMGAQIEGDKMARTGLENLLFKYNVRVNDDRVLTLQPPNPVRLEVVSNPSSDNPVARMGRVSRSQMMLFTFVDCRSVTTAAEAPGGRFTVENVVIAYPGQGVWVEKNLKIGPDARAEELRALLRNDYDKAMETITFSPVPVGVAVSQPRESGRANPHSFASDQQPKLLVFGDANWIANSQISGARGQSHVQLFSACLSWLRERPDVGIISVKAAERTRYNLSKVPGDDYLKLFLQPIGLMLLVVLGMGGAVWVVRRR
jgi:hypothetical protein